MKGVVFTEFLEMVEESFSEDMVDDIIDASDLESGGAYTTLGTYDHDEMVQLVTHLGRLTGVEVSSLIHTFGQHLFRRFSQIYPHFFEGVDTAFEFLGNLEDYIHVEVRKLYPDAELPSFEYDTSVDDQLTMTYRSKRPFGDLAEGLIAGCVEHFDEAISVQRENISEPPETCVKFVLVREAA
ncbi:MAG: hypothetical protein EP343_33765 [Deltaproteobacteria bacterium]|nr:MAG: hypothetical protein EP343_33765 [Deltaproteobacteria bacterium]